MLARVCLSHKEQSQSILSHSKSCADQVLQEWEKAASAWCCSDFEEIGPFHFHRYINLWLCFVFLTKRCNTTLLDSLTSGFVLLSSSSYVTFILTLLQILWAQLLQLFYPVEYGTKITAFCWNCHYQFICWKVFTQCWSLTHKSSLQGDPQQTVLEVLTFEGKESIKLRTLN